MDPQAATPKEANVSQPGSTPGEAVTPKAESGGDLSLIVRAYKGGYLHAERRVAPGAGPVKIGRASSQGLQLDDPSVSRIHAALELSEHGRLSIVDFGSAAGTYVNGRELDEEGARIGPGDLVQVGQVVLEFGGPWTQAPAARGGGGAMRAGIAVAAAIALAVGVLFGLGVL